MTSPCPLLGFCQISLSVVQWFTWWSLGPVTTFRCKLTPNSLITGHRHVSQGHLGEVSTERTGCSSPTGSQPSVLCSQGLFSRPPSRTRSFAHDLSSHNTTISSCHNLLMIQAYKSFNIIIISLVSGPSPHHMHLLMTALARKKGAPRARGHSSLVSPPLSHHYTLYLSILSL